MYEMITYACYVTIDVVCYVSLLNGWYIVIILKLDECIVSGLGYVSIDMIMGIEVMCYVPLLNGGYVVTLSKLDGCIVCC